MRDPVVGLRGELLRMQHLLSRGVFLSFSPDEKQALISDSQKLITKLDSLSDSLLTVGLLGGTGVGKSTMMNALAGAEISSTSHRRPHTHQVLIYHREGVEIPQSILESGVPWHGYAHGVELIRQILLCDLPDYDSLVGRNRESVLSFLEHLDVLVWVSSLEKYADRRFYDFLAAVPKASQNFYFVLNKMDLLFEGRSLETGYEELAKVTARLQQHLVEAEIPAPLIYAISAREALEQRALSPWNQFPGFRHQIFQQRDFKEITAIKAANLDMEVRQVFTNLQRELFNLETVHRSLQEFIAEMEAERGEWTGAGRRAVELWIERNLRTEVLSEMHEPSSLVGPGYGLAVLIQETQKWSQRREGEDATSASFVPPEQTVMSLQHQLDRVQNRFVHRLLRLGLPSSFIDQLKDFLDIEAECRDLALRWREFLEVRLATEVKLSFKRFLATQYLSYLILFLLFIFSIAGETTWRQLVEHPSWNSVLFLFLGAVYTLFSPVGLAALGTYIVLNILLSLRFYFRYKKLLQQHAQKFIESIKAGVEKVWEDELDRVIARLRDYDKEVSAQIAEISVLRKSSTGE